MLMRRALILLALSPLATHRHLQRGVPSEAPFLTDGEAAAWVAKLLESRSRDNVVSDRD